MIRRGTTGSGITEKSVISFNDEADKSDPEIAALIGEGTLDGLLASVERECFAIMESEGLPTYHGCYLFDGKGAWRPPSPPFGGAGIANEIWPIARARGHAPDSRVGYASRMLGDVVWLRRAREAGDHDRAALFHGYLMAKRAEQRIKVHQEPTWETGRKQRQYLGELRDRKNQERHDLREQEWLRWNDKAAEIWSRNPTWTTANVARQVKHDLNLSDAERTVRARLKKVGEAG